MVNEKSLIDLIADVQIELKAPKGQYNSFGKYSYRSAEDILEAVKPILYKFGLTQIITDEIVYVGERYYVKATVTVYLGDQSVSVSAFAREPESKKGMDESQITGTASSYARKYALNGMWCIDDTKDADTDEYEKQTAKRDNGATKTKADSNAGNGYMTTKEVSRFMEDVIDVYGRDEAEICLRKMYEHFKITPETMVKADVRRYDAFVEGWRDQLVNAGY
jgi:hypothetical protein